MSYDDNKPRCTCDTPHGSEARRCSYCWDQILINRQSEPKRKKTKKKVKK